MSRRSPETAGGPPAERGRRTRTSAAADAEGRAERAQDAEERALHALELAYRHLAKRDRTAAEVEHHLARRKIGRPSIERALAELRELGYIDDARYAQRYVEDRRSIDGWGRQRIADGLRRVGIAEPLIEQGLAQPDEDGDEGRALTLLQQRLRGAPLDDDRARGKALRLLATRGFALEIAYDAVRAYERDLRD
ncbi:regulatory protein RecX [Patulibacter brassicae]|uniref:Regulatory protein RecX n=1 Tax=Patulibacter brassicae TaxID=1705717 RepID=A0ABU4VGW4_9ACTN|nr:regulatory protein RecX [Patulibacter brassicae]MDX8150080.1 regulatory protein RecX [Patulibacter brassicae]